MFDERERIERFIGFYFGLLSLLPLLFTVRRSRKRLTNIARLVSRTRARYIHVYMESTSRPKERARASANKCLADYSYVFVRARLLGPDRSRCASQAPPHSSVRVPRAVSRGTRNAAARPLTCVMHMLAPRVTHVLAKREACRVSEHVNKIELVPLRTRWLENNAVISLEAPFPSASFENTTPGFISAAICVYVTNQLWFRTKKYG